MLVRHFKWETILLRTNGFFVVRKKTEVGSAPQHWCTNPKKKGKKNVKMERVTSALCQLNWYFSVSFEKKEGGTGNFVMPG